MKQKHFNSLVENLLEPKNLTTRKNPYHHNDHIIDNFIKLVPRGQPKLCSDCDLEVANRVVHYIVYAIGSKNQHWKKCCQNCGEKFVVKHPFDNDAE